MKGRGAAGNPEGRFAHEARERVDDGWTDSDPELPPFATTVQAEHARTVITRNDSPDIPFEQSINPYRGCEHGCSYCVHADTPILCADGRHRRIEDLKIGDRIIGTVRDGWLRQYVETTVLDHWDSLEPAYRVELADGTELIASGDHRFLTERGWKYVTGRMAGRGRRPYLTTNNSLMGTGAFSPTPAFTPDYKRGYLCGMIRGDAHLGRYEYRTEKRHMVIHSFRLALADDQALTRTRLFLESFDIATRQAEFATAGAGRRSMQMIRNSTIRAFDSITDLIAWPTETTDDWYKGFLAGTFDAEGSFSSVLRIVNSDFEVIGRLSAALDRFGIPHVVEHRIKRTGKSLCVVRVTGGLPQVLKFFHLTAPAITRKLSIAGIGLKSNADLRVRSVEPLGRVMPMCDITTGTGDFIANGVVAHNCYARPSHAYMDLSPGLDFESKLFYKAGAVDLLRSELARPSYRCSPINFGANTDPYQPIEREHRITRSLLEALLEHRHPLTIVTKSALVLRDLELLEAFAALDLVQVFLSVTTLDGELKRTLEPRAASPAARLRAVRELNAAGVPAGVMLAPVIPAINDHEIERIVAAAAEAGATGASWQMLRLPYEVKDIFKAWLAEHRPGRAEHVMSLVRQVRGGRENDARFGSRMKGEGEFAELIAQRFRAACRKHGLADRPWRDLRTDLFRPRVDDRQADLFG